MAKGEAGVEAAALVLAESVFVQIVRPEYPISVVRRVLKSSALNVGSI